MKRMLNFALLFTLVALFAIVAPGLARGASSIQGMVVDTKSNHPLAGAMVSAFSAQSNKLVGIVHSDKKGGFRIAGLDAGEYKLYVAKAGFRSVEVSGLTVDANDRMIIGFPIALQTSPLGSEDTLQLIARCNNLADPTQTADVYVICGGG